MKLIIVLWLLMALAVWTLLRFYIEPLDEFSAHLISYVRRRAKAELAVLLNRLRRHP